MVDDNGHYPDTVYSRGCYCRTLRWGSYLYVSLDFPFHYCRREDADPIETVSNQAGTLD